MYFFTQVIWRAADKISGYFYLGEMKEGSVLNRVSSALSKFVKPVSVAEKSPKTAARSDEEHPSFKRFEKNSSNQQDSGKDSESGNRPGLRMVNPEVEAAQPKAQKELPPITPSVSTSFVELIETVKNQGAQLSHWLAKKTYDASMKRQKKGGRFRKGTMMDEDVG